jgi:probable phosphoglycerate mutase
MTQLLLIRHATNDYVKTGRLAGRTPDVHLNDEGKLQAEALGNRLADTPLTLAVSSPMERCQETAQAVLAHHPHLTLVTNHALNEVDYGEWQGAKISELASRKMWQVIQEYPSRAYFPNGEAMRDVQTRAVNEIEGLVKAHPSEMIAVFSHADLIKMVVAHYLGMHLDVFQRIVISPASITTLQLGHSRPYVGTTNDISHLLKVQPTSKPAL